MKNLLSPKLHIFVILIVIISDTIGIYKISLGVGAMILLPLFYSFILATILNGNVVKISSKIIDKVNLKSAVPFVTIAIMPFIAKFSIGIGPKINEIINAGPALILQELGNLGTMLIAMPIAIVLFKMGRESIGATHSIAREPNIALISDKYGLNSPEGVGVMGVYVVGTLFGTIFFSLMASFLASLNIFSIQALAMGCGVGSGSMTAACSGALIGMKPELESTITAFAAASNVMTYATGLYMSLFIALPLSERIFKALSKSNSLEEGNA
ncbi:DUF3100 domain-containing protein [Arcobacter sp.]|uniref:DUF3100 domain-containing protein n=1 Tax=unclassified Arcobacter TaxID=2593671 RepID=UPI003B00238A|eukprot:TRINITY_DN2468_c0_g1_i6.p2 TRINITY_DN2468_c0_g1~~TRINITY_DN2468_c0_g1_i6.p2  ORF type:complete len:270 (+),score=-42.75 TRINITY_DN2468_c0_g1_i6:185-994(+)